MAHQNDSEKGSRLYTWPCACQPNCGSVIVAIVRPQMKELPANLAELGADSPDTMAFCVKLPASTLMELASRLMAEAIERSLPVEVERLAETATNERSLESAFEAGVDAMRGQLGLLDQWHGCGLATIELKPDPGAPVNYVLAFAAGEKDSAELAKIIRDLKGPPR